MSCVSAEDNITFENDMAAVSSDIDESLSADVGGVTVDADGNAFCGSGLHSPQKSVKSLNG